MISDGQAQIKIETSPVTRGAVHPARLMVPSEAVTERFGFAEMRVLAFEDLYAGKLHAALDRQHPHDLFDVQLLYENEPLTDDLFRGFMVNVRPRSPGAGLERVEQCFPAGSMSCSESAGM